MATHARSRSNLRKQCGIVLLACRSLSRTLLENIGGAAGNRHDGGHEQPSASASASASARRSSDAARSIDRSGAAGRKRDGTRDRAPSPSIGRCLTRAPLAFAVADSQWTPSRPSLSRGITSKQFGALAQAHVNGQKQRSYPARPLASGTAVTQTPRDTAPEEPRTQQTRTRALTAGSCVRTRHRRLHVPRDPRDPVQSF